MAIEIQSSCMYVSDNAQVLETNSTIQYEFFQISILKFEKIFCFPQHLCMGATRMEQDNGTEKNAIKEERERHIYIESNVGTQNVSHD